MSGEQLRLDFRQCKLLLRQRVAEPVPGRIQLLSGPRQVGKTTLLLELADEFGERAVYGAGDAPEATLPGFFERLVGQAEKIATPENQVILLLDEVHRFHGWTARLKSVSDRFRRLKIPIHIVATGSSALRVTAGSRESLAGRFERLTLTHWSASSVVDVFQIEPSQAAELVVRSGTYPGAYPLLADPPRWRAYVRDSILEPAIGHDILALAAVRRPALLRQVFGVAASSPAQIVSLQKIQGQLHDAGALETVAHYLALLEEAFLVAALPKYARRAARRRSAPPKLVTLNNALLAVTEPGGVPDPAGDPARYGAWVENACLAHAWNAGQRVSYWREEPMEVDGIFEGSWGAWAVEVKTGRYDTGDLRSLLEFTRRHPALRPLVICNDEGKATAARAGVESITWGEFLVQGPPSGNPSSG